MVCFFVPLEEDTGVGVILLANQARITSPHFYVSISVFSHIWFSLYLTKIFPFEEGKKTREQKEEGLLAFVVSGEKIIKDKNKK